MGILQLLIMISLAVEVTSISPCDTAWEFTYGMQFCLQSTSLLNSINDYAIRASRKMSNPDTAIPDPDGTALCGSNMTSYQNCVKTFFKSCPDNIQREAELGVSHTRSRLCVQTGPSWQLSNLAKAYLLKVGHYARTFSEELPGDNCVFQALFSGAIDQTSEGACFREIATDEVMDYVNTTSITEAKERLTSGFSDLIRCFHQEIRRSGCEGDVIEGMLVSYILLNPAGLYYRFEELQKLLTDTKGSVGGPRVTVEVFGDPHMRIFNSTVEKFVTCSAVGTWLYLKTGFVTVHGINTPVSGASGQNPPTFLTGLNVTFTAPGGIPVAVFSYTEGGSLPRTFEGGNTIIETGPPDDLEIATFSVSRGVTRLYYSRGEVILTTKKIGTTLTMSVRMPQFFYRAATGILTEGCPLGEDIDRAGAGRTRRDVPNQLCTGLNLTGHLLSACQYDITVTGNNELISDTYKALPDIQQVTEELDDEILNRTSNATNDVNAPQDGGTDDDKVKVYPAKASVLSLHWMLSLLVLLCNLVKVIGRMT